jgi:hypothetical protein
MLLPLVVTVMRRRSWDLQARKKTKAEEGEEGLR